MGSRLKAEGHESRVMGHGEKMRTQAARLKTQEILNKKLRLVDWVLCLSRSATRDAKLKPETCNL
jgi:hypothetical protein